MCLTTMETEPKRMKSCFLFKPVTNASPLRLRLLRVTTEEDEAFRLGRASAVRAIIRKCLRRQPKRRQLAKLAKVLGERAEESVGEESPAAAYVRRRPAGAMAPENTTQYLMNNVYEDMTASERTAASSHLTSAQAQGDATSPGSVDSALDADYDCCLAHQQRDFEQAYGQQW